LVSSNRGSDGCEFGQLIDMELQAVNYITHHIERLPLNDTSYVGERLPRLFQCKEGNDKSRQYLRSNKTSVHNKDRNASRYDSLSNLNENARTLFDTSYDMKSKGLTICELLSKNDQIAALQEGSLPKQQEGVTNNSKRRRSTDSTGSESSKSTCDEEVRRIGMLGKRNMSGRFSKAKHQHDQGEFRKSSSPKKRLLSKLDQRRSKTYDVMQCDGEKRRLLSSMPWFPVRLRSCDKKVKVIRVTPLEHREKDLVTFYGERFREDVYFRPIRADDV